MDRSETGAHVGSMHETLSYFDVLNLVERIECPVLVGLIAKQFSVTR